MGGPTLKPWSLGPVWTALAMIFVLFMGGGGVLLIVTAPSLKATIVSKLLMVVLALAGVAFAVSTLMWSRYWRLVQWDVGFWAFVSGPAPEYPEALLAWRWGRRCRFFWVALMISVFAVPIVEEIAKRLG